MPDAMEIMKDKVEAYQKLLMQKDEIAKQYEDWNSCYEEAIRITEEVKAEYEKDKTPEKEREYLSWVQETQDYFAIVCEYTKKFAKINKEVEEADKKIHKEEAEYIATITKYYKVCSKMNELKKSWEEFKKNGIVGDKMRLLVEEYHKLNEVKQELEKELKDKYNLAINGLSTEEIEEFNKNIPVVTDEMTLDERIAKKKEEMAYYLSIPGKKIRKPHKKQPLVINPKYRDKYIAAERELNKLLEEKAVLENSNHVSPNSVSNSEGLENLFNFAIEEETFVIPKAKPYVLSEEEKAHTEELKGDLLSAYHNPEEDLTQDAKLMSGFSGVENFKTLNKKYNDILEEEKNDKLNDELIEMVNKHSKEISERQNKPKGFMKILNIRKPKNKNKLSAELKKKILAITAAVIILGTTIFALTKSLFKNNNGETKVLSDVYESEINPEYGAQDDSNIQEEPDVKVDFDIQEEENLQINFGYKFNVTNESAIYNNMYDAHLSRNPERKYFSPEYERTVGGLIVNYDGKLECIYANDPEANEKLNMYLANGGKITAVLGELSSGYEGFYKIEDVRSLELGLGGSR